MNTAEYDDAVRYLNEHRNITRRMHLDSDASVQNDTENSLNEAAYSNDQRSPDSVDSFDSSEIGLNGGDSTSSNGNLNAANVNTDADDTNDSIPV